MRAKGYTKQNKSRYYNAYEGDLGGVVENILNQDFKTTKPYEKTGTDVTMFNVNDERVYLSPIIDVHSREVLSYEVGYDAKVVKVMSMLDKLSKVHKDNLNGMIIQSMSRKGNCLDNSPTENFFETTKNFC